MLSQTFLRISCGEDHRWEQCHGIFRTFFLHFDDAAFIENLEVFTESFQQSDKVFLSSVPNGPNFFRELFIKAVSGENDFVPCGVYWWEVPGRDEVWKMKEIENLGSDSFRQEYELGFL